MSLDNRTAKNVDVSAIFDAFMYASDYIDVSNGSTLGEILRKLKHTSFNKEKLKMLEDALSVNPSLRKVRVINQSHTDGVWDGVVESHGSQATDDNIQAWTFEMAADNGVKDYYVAFRGTGDGRWGDNAEGFDCQSTNMQEDARRYFDYVVKKFHLDTNDGKLFVTGHSKGGNNAQYVMMTSEYNDCIDACYSIDGQGFSEIAIKYFKERNGENYEKILQRMYSINGENDYVHFLINPIILPENTYYVEQPGGDPHDIFSIIVAKKCGFEWRRDENGNIINSEPGALGKLSEELMDNLRTLPINEQAACGRAVMSLIEKFIGSGKFYGMDGDAPHAGDFVELVFLGLPIALVSIVETAVDSGLDYIADKLDVLMGDTVIGAAIVYVVDHVMKKGVDIAVHTAIALYDYAVKKVKSFYKLAADTAAWICTQATIVIKYLKKAAQWLYRQSAGYKAASSNPYIEINTTAMHSYATRLSNISRRAKNLDSRMNHLYWNLGINWSTIYNLACLFKAGIILDFAYRIDKCAGYLTDTANDFEAAEREISGSV